MLQFLSDNPERKKLFWRKTPELEHQINHEYGYDRWVVYSRLAIMPKDTR